VGNGLAGQHSQSLEAMFCHIPGLKVVMPATPYDAKGLLKASIRDDDPVIFIENKKLYLTEGEVPEEEYLIPLGKADIKRSGKDITIVSWSFMVPECLKAAEKLAEQGISGEVIDVRTLVPLDEQCIMDSVDKTGRLLIVHEAPIRGGYGGEILSIVIEKAFYSLESPVKRIAGKNTTIPFNITLEKLCIPSVEEIVSGALEVING
jgi:pyruvate dehydrogenase E1 component beta subunit